MKAIAFSAVLLGSVLAEEDHCYALAMSGGGSNGAWEAGVLWGLNHYGNPSDFEWDSLSGVSAGSINACALAGWDPKDGFEAT